MPGQYKPTVAHHFIRLLHDKGLLLRCFTQNIDSLEVEAGIPKDMIVSAHGNFDSATCIGTGKQVDVDEVRNAIMSGPASVDAMNAKHGGLVKPDITFFGERLPERFFACLRDFDRCDLLIVMGTSLTVEARVPSTLPACVAQRCLAHLAC